MSESELRLHRCCFTGHRPEKLICPAQDIKNDFEITILQSINDGFVTYITGMARGVDVWAGQIVLRQHEINPSIHLIVASPYKGFEQRWPSEWKRAYNEVLTAADLVKFVCPDYSKSAFKRGMNGWLTALRVSLQYIMDCRVEPKTPSNTQKA